MRSTILRRTVLGLLSIAVVLSTPVLGLASRAAWQQYDPGSFRATIYGISSITEVEDADGMMNNIAILFDSGIQTSGIPTSG